MSDQAHAIDLHNVHKAYGALQVLKGVDLAVERGAIFGLLGPNGAGKTTLIHTILGLLRPDDGEVRVFGSTDREHLSRSIGYLPERPRYHTHVTGDQYLRVLGELSGLHGRKLRDRIDAVVDLVGLEQAIDRRIGTYSKGMLQRIGIAQAVLHEPDLLIIDEPGSGLDPGGQREMALLLQALKESGHTILMCTHQLTEVARLCDRVGVLANGRIERTASLHDLRAQGHSATIRVAELPLETANALRTIGSHIRVDRNSVTIFPTSDALLTAVLRRLLDDDVIIHAVQPEADALEQFYLASVQRTQMPPPSNGGSSSTDEPSEALLQTLIGDR
jgi:ABC-2 type transport system ATP-binding protein